MEGLGDWLVLSPGGNKNARAPSRAMEANKTTHPCHAHLAHPDPSDSAWLETSTVSLPLTAPTRRSH